ncbi:MAG TPA: FAD:protein FMN transferase [Actinomycetota bacterium]|nr:FAD:protein FMN transferase [Actinomycetota bacterium]
MAMEQEDFRVMGSDATVVVCGGPAGLAQSARRRLDELEALWSRFLPTSEVSQLNQAGGAPIEVSWETQCLVDRALEAWRVTGGAYDPTILGDVLRAGYTVSFEALGSLPSNSPLAGVTLTIGAGGIRVDPDAGTVQLPARVGFDPGGIGKGLAADLVVEELLAAGATGACVNVGGDLRVAGRGPAADPHDPSPDAGWVIGVDDPFGDETVALLGVGSGGVATTSRLRRRWTSPDGHAAHHVIDPHSGRPAASGLAAVTVVADEAWRAEILAKAVFLAGPISGPDLLDEVGAAGLLFPDRGSALPTANLASFLIGGTGTRLLEPSREA